MRVFAQEPKRNGSHSGYSRKSLKLNSSSSAKLGFQFLGTTVQLYREHLRPLVLVKPLPLQNEVLNSSLIAVV